MNPQATHLDCVWNDALGQRCAQLGVALIAVDRNGVIQPTPSGQYCWLVELVIQSKLFAEAVGRTAASWQEGQPFELWPGCWITPLPVCLRRRVIGHRLGVICSTEILKSEQFARLVDAAQLDLAATTHRIEHSNVVAAERVPAMASMLSWMAHDLDEIGQHRSEIDEISQQLSETYEELTLVYNLSARMTVNQAPEKFLAEALDELQQVIGIRWIVLQLNDNDPRLGDLRGKTFCMGEPPLAPARMAQIIGRPLKHATPEDQACIVTDVAEFGFPELRDQVECAMFVPLTTETGVLGAILGGDKTTTDSELSTIDSKLVTSLAQSITIFLENLMLYDDLQDMFMGMLRSLVSAIDAKDAYTCGHSERVAWLGRELGRAARLDEESVERLYLSGLLHDVGKIGVPEMLLAKPGPLSDEEFAIIKTHPRLGARILEGVRQMKDLMPGVLYHHERYDGRGYPDGLAGEDIPLFGRLLCLADSFDAMSSTRTYREAMPLEKVLGEIRRCAGTQFDPELAKIFISLDLEPYMELVQEHQQRESLLRRELRSTQ